MTIKSACLLSLAAAAAVDGPARVHTRSASRGVAGLILDFGSVVSPPRISSSARRTERSPKRSLALAPRAVVAALDPRPFQVDLARFLCLGTVSVYVPVYSPGAVCVRVTWPQPSPCHLPEMSGGVVACITTMASSPIPNVAIIMARVPFEKRGAKT